MAVTRRQKEVLDFLETFVSRNGYSPSFEEIARGMSLKSLATVHKHITNLEKKGMLDRVHNRSRSIDVLPPGSRTRSSLKLPLAGRIAAGLPVEHGELMSERQIIQRELGMGLEAGEEGSQKRQNDIKHDEAYFDRRYSKINLFEGSWSFHHAQAGPAALRFTPRTGRANLPA